MSISTVTNIQIDNQPLLKFNRLVIEQKVNGHHKFSIVHHVSYDLLSSALEKAKSYVGAKVLITVVGSPETSTIYKYKNNNFKL